MKGVKVARSRKLFNLLELTACDRVFAVAAGRERTGIAFLRILKILQAVALQRGPIHIDITAKNSEGAEKITEMIARVTAPSGPRAIFEVAQVRKKVTGGKFVGLVVEQEELADISEDLNLMAVLGDAESGHEGGAGPGRPGAADHIGEAEEGFGTLLLPGSECGW